MIRFSNAGIRWWSVEENPPGCAQFDSTYWKYSSRRGADDSNAITTTHNLSLALFFFLFDVYVYADRGGWRKVQEGGQKIEGILKVLISGLRLVTS